MKTIIAVILTMVFLNTGSSTAQTPYQAGLIKYELFGSDTVISTSRDTLSRKISSSSNTLKDRFPTTYQIVYIMSASKLSISSDPSFPAASTVTLDSLTSYYNFNKLTTGYRSILNFPNIYIKPTSSGTATWFYRLEGY